MPEKSDFSALLAQRQVLSKQTHVSGKHDIATISVIIETSCVVQFRITFSVAKFLGRTFLFAIVSLTFTFLSNRILWKRKAILAPMFTAYRKNRTTKTLLTTILESQKFRQQSPPSYPHSALFSSWSHLPSLYITLLTRIDVQS